MRQRGSRRSRPRPNSKTDENIPDIIDQKDQIVMSSLEQNNDKCLINDDNNSCNVDDNNKSSMMLDIDERY